MLGFFLKFVLNVFTYQKFLLFIDQKFLWSLKILKTLQVNRVRIPKIRKNLSENMKIVRFDNLILSEDFNEQIFIFFQIGMQRYLLPVLD
jgi:hypothetical protein